MGMNTAAVQRLYIAYFNRPADPLAIGDYEAMLPATREATQAELEVLAEKFFSPSLEYQAKYAGLGNADIVNQLYLNIFGRTADIDGLKGWTAALNSGSETVASLALQLSYSAQGTDATVVAARIEAATAFTNGLDTAEEILAYQGTAALAAATAYLEQISGALPTTDAAITTQKDNAIANVNTTIENVVAVGGPEGTTQSLTTVNGDDLTGTNKNDTFKGYVETGAAPATTTMQALDQIAGGDGNDTLEIVAVSTLPGTGLPTLTSIENITARAGTTLALDTSLLAGVTSVSSTKSTTATLTGSATQNLSVSGAAGNIITQGGKNIVVNDANATGDITIGATTAAAGTIQVTDTKAATGDIKVYGGTDVTLNVTGSDGGSVIQVLATATTDGPSGTVNVTSNHTAGVAGAVGMNAITTNGGTKAVVTQTADVSKAATVLSTVTQGVVTVVAGDATTEGTVTQAAAVTQVANVAAVAGVKQVDTITFAAMTAGQTAILGGLTFTASVALTAAQAAAAFANLTPLAKAGSAPTSQGFYTGTFGAFSTGAVTTTTTPAASTVEATEKTAAAADMAIGVGGTAATTKVNKTVGVTAVDAVAGKLGVVGGQVVISDPVSNKDALTTVTLDGFGAASTVDSNVLATLNVANSNEDVTVTSTSTGAITVNLDKAGKAGDKVDVTLAATNTAVTLNATTASVADVTASGATSVTVDATGSLDMSGSAFAAATTFTVKGAGAVVLDGDTAVTTLIDASANSGGVTNVGALANLATVFKGGDGKDSISFGATTKAQTMGGGNDTVTLTGAALGVGGSIDAGTGTDTLVMSGVNAETASSNALFEATITNFNKVDVGSQAANASAATATIDIDTANLDSISHVISQGGTAGTAETQTVAINAGAATAPVVFLGTTLAGSVAGDIGSVTAGLIDAQKATILATWNAANPTKELLSIVKTSNTVITLTFKDTEGNVAVISPAATGLFGGDVASVETLAGVAAGQLNVTNMADGGTVEIKAASQYATVTMADATGSSDTANVAVVGPVADVAAGVVTIANVETVTVTATDGKLDNDGDGVDEVVESHSLTLTADKATKVVVNGDADMALTLTGSAAVTAIDANGLTGALTVDTTVSTAAVTVTGGAGADSLTGGNTNDVLIGGDGADTLQAAAGAGLVSMTGGAGVDTFVINAPSTVDGYSDIKDIVAGETVRLDAGTFKTTTYALDPDTASFQSYANAAAISAGAVDNSATWFQFSGDTYIVQTGDGLAADGFKDGVDAIIKLTGLFDLSTATFNAGGDLII